MALHFLSIQSTYQQVECGLWDHNTLIEERTIHKMDASKNLIPVLNDLFKTHNQLLSSLNFIVVNKGPGPFTTLRVVISTINGLGFVQKIPIIGVDGLDTLAYEYRQHNTDTLSIVLLNAFNQDVYFGIYQNSNLLMKGCASIHTLLETIATQYPTEKIQWLGNGVSLYLSDINHHFQDRSFIPTPLPEFCSHTYIALLGKQKWDNKEDLATSIMPLYLKQTINPTTP